MRLVLLDIDEMNFIANYRLEKISNLYSKYLNNNSHIEDLIDKIASLSSLVNDIKREQEKKE